jgi:colicin import membrane protein
VAKLPPSRAKRSKSEVEKEYSKIAEDVMQQKEAANTKADELNKLREAEVRQAVSGITVDEVVQQITGLGLDVSKSLSQLSEKLVAEVEKLNNLREAAALEARELERLHKMDIAATALDHLVQDYGKQNEELENEIFQQRTKWAEEERERERQQKEAEENLKKQRQREMEDFEYKKSLERKKAQDKYEEETRKQEKENEEKQENLEKSWKLRESALKDKELEWSRLLKEVEGFPARLKNEVDAAVASSVNAAQQRFEQQLALLKKDSEAEKRFAELQISSLKDTLTRQSAEIQALHKQLDEAKRQVQDIAVKAIEGASGAKALTDVKQVLMEQAKTRSPQG